MKRTKFIISFLLLSACCFSQSTYQTTYQQLKEYEGIYEFVNHSTLKIAASPRDTILNAIIHKSNYPLIPFSKDIFLNVSKDKVTFYRNNKSIIVGYIADKDSFRLLSRNVFFPTQMWYPRLDLPYT